MWANTKLRCWYQFSIPFDCKQRNETPAYAIQFFDKTPQSKNIIVFIGNPYRDDN